MTVILSHSSALQYWRKNDLSSVRQAISYARFQKEAPVSVSELQDSLECLPYLTSPVDTLHYRQNARCRVSLGNPHASTAKLPEKSIFQEAHSLGVVCPELCLVQIAEADELQFIKTAFELCGSYRIAPITEFDDSGMRVNVASLTTPAKIRSFASRAEWLRGAKRAQRLAKYVRSGAESPREAGLAMLLGLPRRYGGYGFGMPEMNYRVSATQEARQMAARSHFRMDLYWPSKRLCLEYDSDAHHALQDKIHDDARRRNALQHMNVRVIVVTAAQVGSLAAIDSLANDVRVALGERKRPPCANLDEMRRRLFSVAFARERF